MTRGFRSFHPFLLLVYYIVVIAGITLQQHPVFLSVGFILILLTVFILNEREALKKWSKMIFFLSLFVLILTPIFNRNGEIVVFEVFSREFYLEAIIQGLMVAITLSSILALFTTFNSVITSEKFLYLFSRWFPRWTMILMLALRFIPLFRKRLADIQDVQETKGMSIKHGIIRARARNGMFLMQILLNYSLEEAMQTADSMSARGYGLGKRSKYRFFPWKSRDTFGLVYLVIFSLIIFTGWQLDQSVLIFNSSFKPFKVEPNMSPYLIAWTLLISLPIWAEGKELMKWQLLQRKT